MQWWILAVLLGLTAPAGVRGQDTDSPAEDLIHADLPLYGNDFNEMWPRHIDDDGEIGCQSRVAFGTWRLGRAKEADADDEERTEWYRIANYGVFHCTSLVATAEERKDLSEAAGRFSFFVLIEKAKDHELWAIQEGMRPGSDYILLSRKPDGAIIKRFDVLQRDCPRESIRRIKSIDVFLTGYCAINSRSDLVALARRMARLPPLGQLTFVEGDTGPND
ncbi:hypothetical protein [Sphingomonas asaccharolytica]|uniref:hypothetical protein n=1 Tax=Sphingomonas asaccharolytica TaxID=40681 RepID=UPI00082B63B7|nr:hypothetical protein [Sphingomonas asaccharolytica]